ncbi:MAG: outer membrane beta-barrel protein [Bacteroidetes bacterium]|jgi:hypothetical protein|nr:outer membrane beta-barrel protein [Bacteroidota bacterium]
MIRLLFIYSLIFVAPIAEAQRFDGGIMAGLSASQIDGDTYAGFHKGGLTAGVFAQTDMARYFFTRFEIKYTGKGAAKQDNEDNSDFYKRTLHYIELPILLGYSLPKYEAFSFHGGLSPAYLFHSFQEGTEIATGAVQGYQDFDLGWLLGAAYAINESFSVEARYTYSLLGLTDDAGINGRHYSWLARQLGYNVSDYNNVVNISLYYTIGN